MLFFIIAIITLTLTSVSARKAVDYSIVDNGHSRDCTDIALDELRFCAKKYYAAAIYFETKSYDGYAEKCCPYKDLVDCSTKTFHKFCNGVGTESYPRGLADSFVNNDMAIFCRRAIKNEDIECRNRTHALIIVFEVVAVVWILLLGAACCFGTFKYVKDRSRTEEEVNKYAMLLGYEQATKLKHFSTQKWGELKSKSKSSWDEMQARRAAKRNQSPEV